MPDFSIEHTFSTLVCGIDEAGRGPLAGPVVAAAVILNREVFPEGINDSKKLRKEQRDALFDAICGQAIAFGIGIAGVEEIDRLNILHAALLAMKRAYTAMNVECAVALIDGNFAPSIACKTTCVIKGDSRSLSIAAASILAKVTRDRMMDELAKEYPLYGFESHAGYGTPKHLTALHTYGATPHHRRSFRPVRIALGIEVEQVEMEPA